MREMRRRGFCRSFRIRLSSRFQKTGAASGGRVRRLDANGDAPVGWIGSNQTFPIRAGEAAKALVLKVQRMTQSRDDLGLLYFLSKCRMNPLIHAHAVYLAGRRPWTPRGRKIGERLRSHGSQGANYTAGGRELCESA